MRWVRWMRILNSAQAGGWWMPNLFWVCLRWTWQGRRSWYAIRTIRQCWTKSALTCSGKECARDMTDRRFWRSPAGGGETDENQKRESRQSFAEMCRRLFLCAGPCAKCGSSHLEFCRWSGARTARRVGIKSPCSILEGKPAWTACEINFSKMAKTETKH